MSRPVRNMQRSYSTSHAHIPSYSVTHTVPSLGQGATVVRTPADATMCMAQPSWLNSNSNPWPYRQHSLRESPRRPSVTPSPPVEHVARVASPPPVLPAVETSSFQLTDDINDVHNRHTRNLSTTEHYDLDAEYLRRQASRTSNATITPKRNGKAPLSPDKQSATTPTMITGAWNDHQVATPGTPTPAPLHDQPALRSHEQQQHVDFSSPPRPSMTHVIHTSQSTPHMYNPLSTTHGHDAPSGWQRHSVTASHRPLGSDPAHHARASPPLPPGAARPLVRSATVPSKPPSMSMASSAVAIANLRQTRAELALNEPGQTRPGGASHAHAHSSVPSAIQAPTPTRASSHAPSASMSSPAGLSHVPCTSRISHAQFPSISTPSSAPLSPFSALLVSSSSRVAPGPSMVLITLRFSYSLDVKPNTHEVTITLDTLRPAGGRLISFVDNALRPSSFQSNTSENGCTPPLSVEGPEMTDGSSAEDSDFEYDDTRFHPMLQYVPYRGNTLTPRDEYLVALALASSPSPSPKGFSPTTLSRQPSSSSISRQPSSASISRTPSRRGLGPPPSAYPGSLGFGTPLPPLSALPAALAQARAERDAAAGVGTPPLMIRRPRSNTCPGPAKGTITELAILLQRDAGAWHIIASRLCSGSWPEMAGKRRRVEDECRWAGMDPLLAELTQMPTLSRRGGFV